MADGQEDGESVGFRKRLTRQCTAHAYTVEAINHAIDNGVKGIEHGNLLDKATAKR